MDFRLPSHPKLFAQNIFRKCFVQMFCTYNFRLDRAINYLYKTLLINKNKCFPPYYQAILTLFLISMIQASFIYGKRAISYFSGVRFNWFNRLFDPLYKIKSDNVCTKLYWPCYCLYNIFQHAKQPVISCYGSSWDIKWPFESDKLPIMMIHNISWQF